MASGISFSGLSSGIDTDSIISAMTQAETTQKTSLQSKQNTLKLRQAAYLSLKTGLSAVARAAGTLNSSSAFTLISGTTGDTDIATISATSSASVGSFDLNVTQLAKANKIGSAPQTDTTSALGKTGTASLNGKSFNVEASDSLTSIAKKVNALGAGVSASIVDGGTGRGYLTFTSTTTGAANAVSLADLSGTSMADLGLVGSGKSVRDTEGSAASGYGFSSKSDSIQSLLGATGLPASTLTIGGQSIDVDPTTDTLDSLAGKINAANITGVTATVQAGTKDGATVYSLQISGSGAPPAMSETGGVLKGLGILRATPTGELVEAKDAQYTLDGVPLTSATNTITGAISGATLTLKKVGDTSVTLNKDTAGVTKNVSGLVSAVNDLLTSIKSQSSFDSKTFVSGVLFGDSVARSAKDSVQNMLFSDTPGVSGTFKNLAQIGVGLDSTGAVTLDESIFQAALSKDPDGVSALFQAVGKGSDSNLKYVSATNTAAASGAAGYAVDISQVATKESFVAGMSQISPRTQPETLTFKGSAFGTGGISIDFEAGTDLAATIAKINSDGRLKDLVVASNQNGTLRIDSKRFGTGGNFTVISNQSESGANSGIGFSGGTTVLGVDVAGTINGEPATGNGQFLMGATGNAKTAGLQIQYSGTQTGSVGTLTYTRGVSSRLQDLISSFNDSIKGSLGAADKSLQTQIDGLDKDMTTIDDRITSKTNELKLTFANMEDALAKLKNQSSQVASMLGTTS
jgi:flagellar hook-associated protein 2